jgi:hypothetical protein
VVRRENEELRAARAQQQLTIREMVRSEKQLTSRLHAAHENIEKRMASLQEELQV